MCELDHKYLTKLYGFFFTKEESIIKLNLVLELADTCLKKEIKRRRKLS